MSVWQHEDVQVVDHRLQGIATSLLAAPASSIADLSSVAALATQEAVCLHDLCRRYTHIAEINK